MKTTGIFTIALLVLALMLLPAEVSQAASVGTAFTYQGHLYDANYAANGLYDFQFKLFDANIDTIQLGPDVNKPNIDVIDGYFTTELDFGGSIFDGNSVWLEIGVRPGDMNDPNIYTTLSPRQEVTPTPYALYAKNTPADSDWIIAGGNMYSAVLGNVGIGTASPSAKLDVAGHIKASEYYYVNDKVLVYNPSGTGDFYYGWDLGVKKHIMATNGIERLVIDDSGKVGIGTDQPEKLLHIVNRDGGYAGLGICLDPHGGGFTGGTSWDIDNDGGVFKIVEHAGCGPEFLNNPRIVVVGNCIESPYGGNVGIGTTSPTEALDVNGTAKATAFVGDGSGLTNLPATPDTDWTISGSDMYSAVAGNVGIGTTTPGYKLDVDGSARVTDTLNSSTDLKIATDDGAEVAIGYDIIQFNRKLYVYTDSDAYGVYSSNKNTSGSRYSIYGYGEGDTAGDSYAVFGRSMNAIGNNYGIYGWATNNSSGNNYGVYGRAFNNGTGDGFAGYFDGKVYAAGNVGIGTENPARTLHVDDVMRLEPRATAPSSPSEGDMYMDSTIHKLMVYDGTAWQACW